MDPNPMHWLHHEHKAAAEPAEAPQVDPTEALIVNAEAQTEMPGVLPMSFAPPEMVAEALSATPPTPLVIAPEVLAPLPPRSKETTMADEVITDAEKVIDISEVWISKIDAKVKTIVTAEKAVAPEVAQELSALVTKTQAFLAAATPAVAGEGLDFPADSVAYSTFVDLVTQFQALAVPVDAAIKAL